MHIELTEKEKNELAVDCGYSEERYTDKVKENVKQKLGMTVEDEVAILRKSVAYLFELMSKFHLGELNNAEFAEYNAKVEEIKASAKVELS